jgi:hypothetical protein
MARREEIRVTYKGREATIVTCLDPAKAAELRSRWPNGVVDLEQLHTTPVLPGKGGGNSGRLWLVKTACRVLKIDNWEQVAREGAGIEHRRAPAPKSSDHMRLFAVAAPGKLAKPPRERASRNDRMRSVAGTRRR